MSNIDDSKEISTREMETKENFDKILKAISEMRQDFDKRFEHIEREQAEMKVFMEAQFEAIRQGLVQSHNDYNRMVSEIAENRSAIFSTKALVGELSERVYLMSKDSKHRI